MSTTYYVTVEVTETYGMQVVAENADAARAQVDDLIEQNHPTDIDQMSFEACLGTEITNVEERK